MKKNRLGIEIVTAILSVSLTCGGAIAAASGNPAAGLPFSNTLAFVLLKVDSDSDPQLTALAPMPPADILPPVFAGIMNPHRLPRPALSSRYAFFNPRSPPGIFPRHFRPNR